MKDEQKVWIRGVEGRGKEVIKMLEDLGGENGAWECEDSDAIYFINHSGEIDSVEDYCELGKIIMDNYREIKLPEQWKYGDVLYIKESAAFVVFENYMYMDESGRNHFGALFTIDENGLYLTEQKAIDGYPRLATPSEVNHFHELLHKHGKEWDAEKKQLVEWRWKPKKGDTYYYVDGCTLVEDRTFEGRVFDERHYEVGNCFRTHEEAEAMAEKIKKLLKGEAD